MNQHTVFLVRQLNYGGAQRQLVTLVKGLAARGEKVTVMSFYPAGKLDQDLLDHGIPIVCLNKKGRWDNGPFFRRMVQELQRLQPTVIHGYLGIPNLFTIALKPFFPKTRMVWGIRESDPFSDRQRLLTRMINHVELWLSRQADLIILNSHRGKVNYQAAGYPADKMVVISNGIDTDRFVPNAEARATLRQAWGWTPEERVIGCVGRLNPAKDHTAFLKAAALLHAQYPHLRFVCVGKADSDQDGAYVRSLHQLASSLGLDSVLQWREPTHEIEAVYNAIDLLVLTSCKSEGFPNVLGEAMACGTPCVSTAVGDAAVVLGEWGATVPPENPVAIAEAIVQVIGLAIEPSGSLRSTSDHPLQPYRHHIVEHFSVDALVEKTATILTHLTLLPTP